MIAVCSWSLRPRSPRDLAERVRACGLSAVQLALDPVRRAAASPRDAAWSEAETAAALRCAGITIVSGMMAMRGEDYSTLESIRETGGVRPDADWPLNLAAARANAALARRLKIPLVTFHAGFLPHDDADPLRGVMLARLRAVIDAFAAEGVATALETGQESAETLLAVLHELAGSGPAPGVNFDPANMLLYGTGDPVAAFRALAPHVRQVHIKDADPSPAPGRWGVERRAGEGGVDWPGFFAALKLRRPGVNLAVERESGDTRVEDVRAAAALAARAL